MSNTTNLIGIFEKIFASYSLALIILGSIFNSLVCFICLKSKTLRSTSTFKMLAIVAISDLISLFEWNADNFSIAFFNYLAYTQNLFFCRFVTMFLQYATLEISSWMWVSISLDRYLSLRVKRWRKHYFRGYRAVLLAIGLVIFIVAINFVEIFKNGYSFVVNGTEVVVCGATSENNFFWFQLMSQVSLILDNLILS